MQLGLRMRCDIVCDGVLSRGSTSCLVCVCLCGCGGRRVCLWFFFLVEGRRLSGAVCAYASLFGLGVCVCVCVCVYVSQCVMSVCVCVWVKGEWVFQCKNSVAG